MPDEAYDYYEYNNASLHIRSLFNQPSLELL